MKTYNNKIVIVYFLYLLIGSFFYLNLHINEFPDKYVFTDWLINYEGGFVRRGLLGEIIYEISNSLHFNIKTTLFFFSSNYLFYIFFSFFLFIIKNKD